MFPFQFRVGAIRMDRFREIPGHAKDDREKEEGEEPKNGRKDDRDVGGLERGFQIRDIDDQCTSEKHRGEEGKGSLFQVPGQIVDHGYDKTGKCSEKGDDVHKCGVGDEGGKGDRIGIDEKKEKEESAIEKGERKYVHCQNAQELAPVHFLGGDWDDPEEFGGGIMVDMPDRIRQCTTGDHNVDRKEEVSWG